MSKNCIISVATRHYTIYQKRLIETAEALEVPIIYWTDKYPPGSRDHHSSLYGFKIYAFRHAFGLGYENVLWLDAPCYLLSDPTEIFKEIETDGHYLINTSPLWKHLDRRTCNHFKLNVTDIKHRGYGLLCGSFIGFRKGSELLDEWQKMEQNNFFLNAMEDANQENWYEGFQGMKHDETQLSLLAHTKGLKVIDHGESHFQLENSIVKSDKWEIKT